MQLGKFNIDVLDTGIFGLDGGSMFGVAPKAVWSEAYHSGDEVNRIPLAARPLFVRWEDKILLVDTGNGDKMREKLLKIYNIDKNKSSAIKALEKFGIEPENVSDVILTHLHFDHAGGSTRLDGEKAVPSFPNARYYVQKEQLEWAFSPTEKDRASYMRNDFQPLMDENLLETLDGFIELFPGISLIPLYGHTKAMQLVRIEDMGQSLIFCADLAPTSAHIHIPFILGFDNFPLTTLDEKKRIWGQAYEESSIIVLEHDAFIQAVKIKANDKGFSAAEKIVISS